MMSKQLLRVRMKSIGRKAERVDPPLKVLKVKLTNQNTNNLKT